MPARQPIGPKLVKIHSWGTSGQMCEICFVMTFIYSFITFLGFYTGKKVPEQILTISSKDMEMPKGVPL